ncbi:MAG TPA: EAL domain-containing protein [Gammaproteobacteria bacterium]|nr:EAL domain-containing protein [Gammaproteobacteria bacterium]
MKRPYTGLRARLLLLVLMAVLPVFGLIGYTAVSQRHEATAAAKRDTMTLVRLAAREQSQLIANTRQLLMGLAKVPAVKHLDPVACHRIMVELSKPYPYYMNFGVATPAGDVVCSAVPLRHPVSIADRSYFRRAVLTRQLGIGDYQTGRITGVNAINFGYPVLDDKGDLKGVVYAAFSLEWLNQMVGTVDLPQGSSLMVVDSAGTVLTRTPDAGRWTGRSVRTMPLANMILARQRKGTAEMPGLDGVRRLYAFAPLDEAPQGNVYVSVGIPTAVAYAAERRQFRHSMMLFFVVAALALVTAWVGSNMFVLRHVRRLADAARRMGRGDLSARTGMRQGKDELGQLVAAFDDMAHSLERIDRALKTLSAGNRAVLRANNEQALLEQMCRVIVEVGGYLCAWVGYPEHDEGKSVRAVAQAGFEGGMEAINEVVSGVLAISWADTARGQGPLGTAIRTGRQCVAQNILTDPDYAPWREVANAHGFASVSAFPLRVQGEVIGALAIYAKEPDAFHKEELDLLAEAAEDLAYGVGTLRTRAEHEQAHETIKRMAYYDGLTGLPNHIYLQERLRETLCATGAHGETIALVLLDLDRFGEVNAGLGFGQGDLLLKEIGRRLSAGVGDSGTVARMRGDEFAVVLPVRDMGYAGDAAARMLDALEAPFDAGNLTLHVSAAAGISLSPQHGTDPARLIRHADVAMHQSKRSGQRYVFYTRERDENGPRHLALAGELSRAIQDHDLMLYYQPKVDLAHGRVCGVEALARWFHPRRGPIPPDQFIPLAERTGLIKPLTDWVLDAALSQSHAWAGRGLQLPIAVNLSARNLRDADLANGIERRMTGTDAQAGTLDLEITESAVMEDPQGALEILARLRALGASLFIDDFGTGYSSLGYLKKLPVNAVKIDKSFVFDMLENSDSAAIVRSTITLAHDLGLEVVAEGVETLAVWERLKELGCDVAQGYYISKPLSAEQFIQWWSGNGGEFKPDCTTAEIGVRT